MPPATRPCYMSPQCALHEVILSLLTRRCNMSLQHDPSCLPILKIQRMCDNCISGSHKSECEMRSQPVSRPSKILLYTLVNELLECKSDPGEHHPCFQQSLEELCLGFYFRRTAFWFRSIACPCSNDFLA